MSDLTASEQYLLKWLAQTLTVHELPLPPSEGLAFIQPFADFGPNAARDKARMFGGFI